MDKKEENEKTEEKEEKEKTEEPKEIQSWDELNISDDVLRGIYSYGFEKPSPIQSKAINSILEGKDIIAQAQSGTGKTGAFAIGALSKVDVTQNTTQVMILSPTRELSIQTMNVLMSLGSMMKGLNIMNIVGGTSIDHDVSLLKKNKPHIVKGCPGRM